MDVGQNASEQRTGQKQFLDCRTIGGKQEMIVFEGFLDALQDRGYRERIKEKEDTFGGYFGRQGRGIKEDVFEGFGGHDGGFRVRYVCSSSGVGPDYVSTYTEAKVTFYDDCVKSYYYYAGEREPYNDVLETVREDKAEVTHWVSNALEGAIINRSGQYGITWVIKRELYSSLPSEILSSIRFVPENEATEYVRFKRD